MVMIHHGVANVAIMYLYRATSPIFSSTKCEVTIYDMFEQDWSDRTTNNVIPTSKPCAMTTIVFPPVNPAILDVYVMQCF